MKNHNLTFVGLLLKSKGTLSLTILATILLAIVAPFKSYILQWLVDTSSREEAYRSLVFGMIIVALSHILEYISKETFIRAALCSIEEIRNSIFVAQPSKTMENYLSNNSGDVLSTLTTEMRVIYNDYYMSIYNIALYGGMGIVSLFMLNDISLILLIAALLLGSLPLIVPKVLGKYLAKRRLHLA